MSTRAVEKASWDWEFGYGLSNYLTAIEEIVQNIQTGLKSWKNNCFFDLDYGINWLNILGSFNQKELARKEITNMILSVNGVQSINDLQMQLTEDRNLKVNIYIKTIYGEDIEITEEMVQ